MIWRGQQAKAAMRRGAARGLKAMADDVYERSQSLIPEAPGDVRGSGYMKKTGRVEVDERELRAMVSYDSPPRRADGRSQSRSVIVFIHEDMNAKHAEGKQAKFLEVPLSEATRLGGEVIARSVRRELR